MPTLPMNSKVGIQLIAKVICEEASFWKMSFLPGFVQALNRPI